MCGPDGHRVITERLLLRTMVPGDREGFFAVVSDEEVMRWQGYPSDPAALEKYVEHWIARSQQDLGYQASEDLIICDRSTGEVIGVRRITPFRLEDRSWLMSCEIGSSIREGWRGKGLGREELAGTLRFINQHLSYSNVFAASEETNLRAIHQYQSAGFKPIGVKDRQLPNGRTVHAVAMLRADPARRTCPLKPHKNADANRPLG